MNITRIEALQNDVKELRAEVAALRELLEDVKHGVSLVGRDVSLILHPEYRDIPIAGRLLETLLPEFDQRYVRRCDSKRPIPGMPRATWMVCLKRFGHGGACDEIMIDADEDNPYRMHPENKLTGTDSSESPDSNKSGGGPK